VAACPPEVQLQRLIQRNNLSASEAARRIASQLPIDAKVDLADYVVDTSGTIEETDRQVEDVWRRLTHED
jgi:dephospho-CoA kinase